jgi:four helix bundle protein
MTDSLIKEKSFRFAVRIVRLYQHLTEDRKEFVLSKQILRSWTSIGANVREATQAESKADFIHKLPIALKEASETEYWLELRRETDYLNEASFNSIHTDCKELLRLLTSIIKSSKQGKNDIH